MQPWMDLDRLVENEKRVKGWYRFMTRSGICGIYRRVLVGCFVNHFWVTVTSADRAR